LKKEGKCQKRFLLLTELVISDLDRTLDEYPHYIPIIRDVASKRLLETGTKPDNYSPSTGYATLRESLLDPQTRKNRVLLRKKYSAPSVDHQCDMHWIEEFEDIVHPEHLANLSQHELLVINHRVSQCLSKLGNFLAESSQTNKQHK